MNNFVRFIVSIVLVFALFSNALPCGPSYISPIFEYEHAPDDPFENFAAGKIGIVKPAQRRIVLLAAYRYLNGGGFTANEQKALVEVWNAEFNNKDYEDKSAIDEAVKNWIAKRKEVFADKEEKIPEIYVEREEGGYDFFPNCAKNAFETAAKTLSERMTSYGSDNKDVKEWVKAQDKVFNNCSSGKQIPEPPDATQPEWLQKDRAYQIAAAAFYSLDFAEAKQRFAEIAQDGESPWQETANYLVGRTLIRQASLSKSVEQANSLYAEAEQRLQEVAARSSKFGGDAERLLGLIEYRLRPKERVVNLGQRLSFQGDENFRQDLIDYNWLLDKFVKETLETEEKRKSDENLRNANRIYANSTNVLVNTVPLPSNREEVSSNVDSTNSNKPEGYLEIYIYSDDSSQNWTIYVKPEATDEEAFAEAEKVMGRPLTDKMKERIRAGKKYAYKERFSGNSQRDYQGSYYGSEEISLSLLPHFLRQTEMTDWLFTFQIQNTEAYLYALKRYKQTSSDLWLMTAISKADKASTELNRLLEDAGKISESSPVYPTIVYHLARILIEQNKPSEARKALDDALDSSLDLPVSSRNNYLQLRLKLAETLEDFLRFAQRKPFAFDWDGQSGSIDFFIAQQKKWYNPEYETKSREEYEREIEENYKEEKLWQDRLMFDYETVEIMNQHFPTSVLLEAQKSPSLPDYLRGRLALAIWTRAVLLEDYPTAAKIAPEVLKYNPELTELMNRFLAAKTPVGTQNAALYLILKNPMLTPYLEDGLPRSDNEFGNFDANDWWCEPYEEVYDDKLNENVPKKLPNKPSFLTQTQSMTAQAERKKLKTKGDAPKYLADRVLAWAKRSPTDKRVPESLFIIWQANGWTKYGCGSNIELQQQIGDFMKKKYPDSDWTKKMLEEEQQ